MFRSHLEVERRDAVTEFPKIPEKQSAGNQKFHIKVRLDYRGVPRPSRFIFGGKGSREMAEELRQQQAAMWRNVPLQGIRIEDANFFELYSVYDDLEDEVFYFAPMELKVSVDSLEDCVRFICREEFRRIEIVEPAEITLSSRDLERIFFRVSESMQQRLREYDMK